MRKAEAMIMAEADQIIQARAGDRAGDVIEVIHSNPETVQIQLQELSLCLHTRIGLACDAI